MDFVCNNSMFDIVFLILKYLIPGLLLLIGFIKLVVISNSSKAIKTFIKFFLIGIIVFFIFHVCAIGINHFCSSYDYGGETNTETNYGDIIDEADSSQDEVVSSEEGFSIEVIDGITYVDGILIVNKTYALPSDYRPSNSVGYDRCNNCISSETMAAFNAMKADATSIGLNLYISSGFRSYSYQNELYERYASSDGYAKADTYSARPGHSEHQTGLAFDLNSIDDSFANTSEGKWVFDNCYRYGLILRYPKGKENITGYQYESWHLRYVGEELASKLYNDGDWITLEEYFGLTSSYE